ESIRTVGTSAFMNCQNMGRALFNDATALTSLGDSVFYGCTRMTICTFSDDESGDYTNFKVIPNAAFQACTSLNTVVLASTLNEVGQSAFRYCTSLRVCDFSNTTVSKIGDYAFENCDLSGYTLNSPAIQTIGNYAFFNTNIVKITDCHLLQSIGSTAFTNCTKLTTFDLDPADHRLNHIGSSAFAKCTSLQDFTFPHTITDIQEAAFMYCTSLTKVVFDRDEGATPQITTFSKNCFAYCTSLKSIEIPENVTTIVSGAFEFTPALEKFDCKASKFTTDAHSALMSSDKTVFVHYPSMSKSMISGNEGPVENYTGYVVPETVTSMHEGAFTDAAYLTKIVLPSKLTYVPRDCFAGTKALKEVTIPAAVTEIRQGIFAEGAEALTDLYITGDPSKITILYPSTQFIRTSAAASKRTLHVKPKYLAAWQDHDYADNFGTVTSNVTIKIPSSGYATICRDYDIDLQSVSGTAKIYALTGFNTQTGEFTLTQVTQVTTPSGGKTTRTYISSRTDANNATYTPLIITGNKNSTITAKMGDYDYGESTFYKTVVSNNTLGAALVDTHTPYANRNMYFLVLKNGDFHFLKESGVIPYGKAYAMLSHSSAGNWYSNAKSKDEGLSLVFVDADDSETTGISTVDNGQLSIDNAAWYTLDGVKLNAEPTQKGLYIKNGKKIVIK
ncbi:MAG: leucine-rich repeat domain-containing protein, partial [Prevotella sp.]|nr:leucine-rich repeat domain-containing protein [Prevotella sp.]